MSDGPNYERLFRECKCLNWETHSKTIVDYLRFTTGEGEDGSPYLAHYLPMLPADVAAEFVKKPKKAEKVVEAPVEEKVADTPITETVVTEVPKKKGRPAKKF